jgi:hypothetical protein
MPTHTPLPWVNNGGQIEGPGGFPNVVAHVGQVNNQSFQDAANARFILQACNAHAELLAALEHLLRATYDMTSPRSRAFQQAEAEARAAIAKAKGT